MSSHQHSIKSSLALALAISLIAPAAASARFDLNPAPTSTSPSSSVSAQPPVVVRVTAHDGFDWTDAGIGAAGIVGLSTLAVGGGLITVRRRGNRRSTAGLNRPDRAHGTPDADSLSRVDSAPARQADGRAHVG